MYGGMCHGEYMKSILSTFLFFKNINIECSLGTISNESLIQRARNTLATNFLQQTDFTHLMFIDGDIKFNPSDILRMMQSDKEIICGVYPAKFINWSRISNAVKNNIEPNQLQFHTGGFVVNFKDYEYGAKSIKNPEEPIEIWNGGTGFMLIQRNVLEKLSTVVENYLNDNSEETIGQVIYNFFPVFIDQKSKRLLSEDYAFCKVARENDIKIWMAPWVKLSHMGTYEFNGNF